MRIDRRNHPAHRTIPALEGTFAKPEASGQKAAEQGEPVKPRMRDGTTERADGPNPSNAFGALKRGGKGLLKDIAAVFSAVGKARRDLKHSDFKTFD